MAYRRLSQICKICKVVLREWNSEPNNSTCEPCRITKRDAYMATYRAVNREEQNAKTRARRIANPAKTADQTRRSNATRYAKNPGKVKAAAAARYAANPEPWRERTAQNIRKRRAIDPDGEKAKINARARLRRQTNLTVAVSGRMSNRIWTALKRKGGKKKPWLRYVDYTVDQLIARLQETMPWGYTWADFMAGKLHIDHKRPVASFIFTNAEDPAFRECWALSNLQLLPAADNLQKNAKLNWRPSISPG